MPRLVGFTSAPASGIQFVGGKLQAAVGISSGTYDLTISSGLTGGIGTGAAAGDLVVAIQATAASYFYNSGYLTFSDGTTQYTYNSNEVASIDDSCSFRVGYKFMSGTPDTFIRFDDNYNVGDGQVYACLVFRNVDTVTPWDTGGFFSTNTGTCAAEPPVVTPSTAPTMLIGIGAATPVNPTGDVTYTDSFYDSFFTTYASDTYDMAFGMGVKYLNTTDQADPAVWTVVNDTNTINDEWVAYSRVLRQA